MHSSRRRERTATMNTAPPSLSRSSVGDRGGATRSITGTSACGSVERGLSRLLLPTREAAAYCGFKNPSGLRKAHVEGRIFPVGRRGGVGTWMWAIADLDAFL